jgi:branched-chain amino acid transport system ATP-binding protein
MALEIASRFYLLDKGKVVRSGKAEELLDESELEKAYLGA